MNIPVERTLIEAAIQVLNKVAIADMEYIGGLIDRLQEAINIVEDFENDNRTR